ncbi:hypothetical protein ATO13_23511 [Stappia sp. 22II-S9-Z10]|nr:hypothetical protein ATO13_23511 [Stappia sp. 22II-S9-Z10]
MAQSSNKPTHRLVRFYGQGQNAPSAELGIIFKGDDGRQTIILNTPSDQIRLMAFPIQASTGAAQ